MESHNKRVEPVICVSADLAHTVEDNSATDQLAASSATDRAKHPIGKETKFKETVWETSMKSPIIPLWQATASQAVRDAKRVKEMKDSPPGSCMPAMTPLGIWIPVQCQSTQPRDTTCTMQPADRVRPTVWNRARTCTPGWATPHRKSLSHGLPRWTAGSPP